jgi:DNA repair protein RadA/Sms
VGLSGEIRPVGQTDRRIAEASRLGFRRIFVSSYTPLPDNLPKEIKVVKVADVPALVKALFKNA